MTYLVEEEDYLAHYGILRRSGRYPWGSGGDVETRARSFVEWVKNLLNLGYSDAQIAKMVEVDDDGTPLSLTELRDARTIANAEIKAADIAMATRLREKGLAPSAIARRMDRPESSVRALLAPGAQDKIDQLRSIAGKLQQRVDEHGYLDIGAGVENHLNVSPERLRAAVHMLRDQGYVTLKVQEDQISGQGKTTIKVLAKPGTTYREVVNNREKIAQIYDFSDDGGRTWSAIQPPLSINSKRVDIRYKEDGGDQADGVIFVRPGVDDLDMGGARYAQVRIAVDGTHYIKGMAIYKTDLPDGVDLQFNTNKSSTGNKLDALKKMNRDQDDPTIIDTENPFGATVSQLPKVDANGKTIPNTVRSAMNIVNHEGQWEDWSSTLSSQMLSKQSHLLAKRQLDVAYEIRRDELDEIMALTNPAVKRRLLENFADGADSAAWQLKAASLPGQRTQVILPVEKMKDTEVYAPNFNDGDRVALVRFPHGGTFEIPELTVNNRNPSAKKLLGQAKDAIGINAKVAERLSGADFDGDTVLVIPNNKGLIKSSPALERLKDFDPKAAYPEYEGMKRMTPQQKQREMGVVSNLITDMTIRGANENELAAAVRHSMVVIDAEKHKLNWKQSAQDNNIASLSKKYQSPYNESGRAGASTLISRRKSEVTVEKRKQRGVDPLTGKKVFAEDPDSYTTRDGRVVIKTEKRKKIEVLDDVNSLSSGTQIEKVYADYSNQMKALANEARRSAVNTPPLKRSPSAAKVYANEVASIEAKLNLAMRNRPKERAAQLLANAEFKKKRDVSPDMDRAEEKKLKYQALERARNRLGAGKPRIEFTPDEWRAVQEGAISNSKLKQILDNADLEQVKQLATPKATVLMTSSKQQRAKNLMATGMTQAEVANILGVSLSTLKRSVQ